MVLANAEAEATRRREAEERVYRELRSPSQNHNVPTEALLGHARYWRQLSPADNHNMEVFAFVFEWYLRRYGMDKHAPTTQLTTGHLMAMPIARVFERASYWDGVSDLIRFDFFAPPPDVGLVLSGLRSTELEIISLLSAQATSVFRLHHDFFYRHSWNMLCESQLLLRSRHNAVVERLSHHNEAVERLSRHHEVVERLEYWSTYGKWFAEGVPRPMTEALTQLERRSRRMLSDMYEVVIDKWAIAFLLASLLPASSLLSEVLAHDVVVELILKEAFGVSLAVSRLSRGLPVCQ